MTKEFGIRIAFVFVLFLLSLVSIGAGWFLVAGMLNINIESLRFWDWVMIALFTRVFILGSVRYRYE